MLEIRKIKSEEYCDCADLLSGSTYYGNTKPSQLAGAEMVGVFHGPEHTLVGCAMLLVSGPQAYVDYFFVHPVYQQEGVGMKLARYVTHDLSLRGVTTLHACVSTENKVMLGLIDKFNPRTDWPYTNVVIALQEEPNGN